MLASILTCSIFGIIAGIITGLIPGLHINTIAIIMLSIYYKYNPNPILVSSFIISMSVTHTFTDFIPSVFLGAPDEKTVASMLPAHKMMKEGRGYEAIIHSVAGGLCGIMILIISIPLMFMIIPILYSKIISIMAILLTTAMIFIIYTINPKKRLISIALLLYAGLLGHLVLNFHHINSNYLLLPLFSGMFGISSMLESLNDRNNIPIQTKSFELKFSKSLGYSVNGFMGGIIAGFLPGLGSSQSIVLINSLKKETTKEEYITSTGTIGTIDIIISFISLYLIGNARSGSSVVISNITDNIGAYEVFLFISVCIFSAGIAAIITILIGKRISSLLHRLDMKRITIAIIILIISITFYFTQFYGLLILITSTALGTLALKLELRKSLLLGCLIIPTILFFIRL